MTEERMLVVLARARTCKRHIRLAEKRMAVKPSRKTSEFIRCLQRAYDKQCDLMPFLTTVVVCVMLFVQGCNTIASVGDLTQALGKDIRIVAEGTADRMAR